MVPSLGWASGRITGAAAYYLLTEVMEFSAILVNVDTVLDDQPVNYVAGCSDPNDVECKVWNLTNPSLHFTVETWMLGSRRATKLPNEVKPVLLGVLDFSVDDSYFVKRSIFIAGQQGESPAFLDNYRFYDAQRFKPHVFFDPWNSMYELLPPSLMVRCSAMTPDGENARDAAHYTRVTGDSDVACHHNDTVWFSPACRANTTECVPIMVQYAVENIMQLAFFLRMPLAVIVVDRGQHDYLEYYRAIEAGRFLFSHWAPMDVLRDADGGFPMLLDLPRTNMQEQLAGVFRTGIADIKPRNYAWRLLPQIDPRVAFFASRINFFDQDMQQLMHRSADLNASGLDSIQIGARVACEWLRANRPSWQAWIPADCPQGQRADGTLASCVPCEAGSFCVGQYSPAATCPPHSFCPAGASAPTPCPGQMETADSGATSADSCTVCPAGALQIGAAQCVAYVLVLPLVIGLSALCVCGAVLGYLQYRAVHEEALWRIKGSDVTVSDPPEVLGRGWQGVVVRGEHRGTPVAIKRFRGPGQAVPATAQPKLGGAEPATTEPDGDVSDVELGMDRASSAPLSEAASGLCQPEDSDGSGWVDGPSGEWPRMSRRSFGAALRRDLRLLVGIRHPCVVTVMGVARLRVGGGRQELCLVMELMALGSLRDLLANRMCPLYGETALGFLRSVAQGMRFLHAASPPVLHGDLASHNVLVDGQFKAKLADIQLASLRARSPSVLPPSSRAASGMSSRPAATYHASWSGSGGSIWIAPELACGGGPTAAGDVYAFGLIIHEVLTRKCLGAHLSDSDSDRSMSHTPRARSASGVRRSSARSPQFASAAAAQPTKDLPDPPGASAEVTGLLRECLRAEPERRPPFQELDRRLAALDVSLMTSVAFAEDVDGGASPPRSPSGARGSPVPRRWQRAGPSPEAAPAAQGRNSDTIMHSLFPPHVVEALIMGRPVPPEPKELVTVFFSDIVGFTTLSSTLDPAQVPHVARNGCPLMVAQCRHVRRWQPKLFRCSHLSRNERRPVSASDSAALSASWDSACRWRSRFCSLSQGRRCMLKGWRDWEIS